MSCVFLQAWAQFDCLKMFVGQIGHNNSTSKLGDLKHTCDYFPSGINEFPFPDLWFPQNKNIWPSCCAHLHDF